MRTGESRAEGDLGPARMDHLQLSQTSKSENIKRDLLMHVFSFIYNFYLTHHLTGFAKYDVASCSHLRISGIDPAGCSRLCAAGGHPPGVCRARPLHSPDLQYPKSINHLAKYSLIERIMMCTYIHDIITYVSSSYVRIQYQCCGGLKFEWRETL